MGTDARDLGLGEDLAALQQAERILLRDLATGEPLGLRCGDSAEAEIEVGRGGAGGGHGLPAGTGLRAGCRRGFPGSGDRTLTFPCGGLTC